MRLIKKGVAFVGTFAVVALVTSPAFAQDAANAAGNAYSMFGWFGLAAGLGIGLGAFGGAIGMGRAVDSAMEGIARNPGASGDMFIPYFVGLALIESLVIYAFLIAYFVQGNIQLSMVGG